MSNISNRSASFWGVKRVGFIVRFPNQSPGIRQGKCLEYRYGIVQEKLDFSLKTGGHGDEPGAEVFRVDMLDKQAMVDGDLDVFDRGALADVRHERVQLGLLEDMG